LNDWSGLRKIWHVFFVLYESVLRMKLRAFR